MFTGTLFVVPLLCVVAVQNSVESVSLAAHPHGTTHNLEKVRGHPQSTRHHVGKLAAHSHGGTNESKCRHGSCTSQKRFLASEDGNGVVEVTIAPANKKHAGSPTGLSIAVGASDIVETGPIEHEKKLAGVQTKCTSGAQDITLENVLTGKDNGFLLQWISFKYAHGDCYIPTGIVTPDGRTLPFPRDGFWLDTPCDGSYEYEQECYGGQVTVTMGRSTQCDMPSLQASIHMGTSKNAHSKTGVTLQVGAGPVVSVDTLVDRGVKVVVPAIEMEGAHAVHLAAQDSDGYLLDWLYYKYAGEGSRCYVPDKMLVGGTTVDFPPEGFWLDYPCTKSSYYGQACYEEVTVAMKMHPTSCEKNQPYPGLRIEFEAVTHVHAHSGTGLSIKVGSTGEEISSGPLADKTSKMLEGIVDVDTVTLAAGGSDGFLMRWFSLKFAGDSVCYIPTMFTYNGVTEDFPSVGLAFDRESNGRCDEGYDYSPRTCYSDPVVFRMTEADSCDAPEVQQTLVSEVFRPGRKSLPGPDALVTDVCQPVLELEARGSTVPGATIWMPGEGSVWTRVDTSQFPGCERCDHTIHISGLNGGLPGNLLYTSIRLVRDDFFIVVVQYADKKSNSPTGFRNWHVLWSRTPRG